jgi:excisionase family DNA binding protein
MPCFKPESENRTSQQISLEHFPVARSSPAPAPLTYSVKGAMAASGLGRSTIFQLMADGRLDRVKIGKRTLIPRASLEALLSGEVS